MRAVADVRAVVDAVVRLRDRSPLGLVGVDAAMLVRSGLAPARLVSADALYVAQRYPVTVRAALDPAHGLDGAAVASFVARDALSFVVTVGTPALPIPGGAECLALLSAVPPVPAPSGAPSARVAVALLPAEGGVVPAPDASWLSGAPPPWDAALVPGGAGTLGRHWYARGHGALEPATAAGRALYSTLAAACGAVEAAVIAYGVSAL